MLAQEQEHLSILKALCCGSREWDVRESESETSQWPEVFVCVGSSDSSVSSTCCPSVLYLDANISTSTLCSLYILSIINPYLNLFSFSIMHHKSLPQCSAVILSIINTYLNALQSLYIIHHPSLPLPSSALLSLSPSLSIHLY